MARRKIVKVINLDVNVIDDEWTKEISGMDPGNVCRCSYADRESVHPITSLIKKVASDGSDWTICGDKEKDATFIIRLK